jgi:anti-sigma regulatory factor (Ser/Thr protein kinase)
VPTETVRLRIKNVAKAVLVSGQSYQDPKDALNEFISNAADEYAEAGIVGGRIRVVLHRRGQRPYVAVDDDGRGLSADRLREVARSLFESAKAGDDRTLGEKAIGLLAYQQLGGRCEVVSRTPDGPATASLRLERGSARAVLDAHERRRRRDRPGTTIYLLDLDPDVLRMMTQRKVVDYLRRRRGPALARGDYQIVVEEGRAAELVTPEEPDGIHIDLPARPTLWGRVEFNLYVAPQPDRHRRVAVVGRAGTTIIDNLAELDEFDHLPWTSDQLSGQISFESLQQTAGRRAILRDREAFPVFVDAVGAVERVVATTLEHVAREVDQAMAERLSDTVRRIFGRVLKELADLDNPMRTLLGDEPGDGALLAAIAGPQSNGKPGPVEAPGSELPQLPEPPPEQPALDDSTLDATARPGQTRSRALPTVAPDPTPGVARSRFDADAGVVYYHEAHSDYLMVKDDEVALLDYLATLVAKEYVVYNNPRATADDLGEEMVRMLIRVRRHLPRRR